MHFTNNNIDNDNNYEIIIMKMNIKQIHYRWHFTVKIPMHKFSLLKITLKAKKRINTF